MQKLVIDTNVLVSAIISKSFPYFILRTIFSDKNLEWCVSEEIMREYQMVLSRQKFMKYPGFTLHAENLLVSIDTFGKMYKPEIRLDIISDPDDNRFLELAVTANADFLITGNTNDFILNSFQGIKIVTPKEYYEQYRL